MAEKALEQVQANPNASSSEIEAKLTALIKATQSQKQWDNNGTYNKTAKVLTTVLTGVLANQSAGAIGTKLAGPTVNNLIKQATTDENGDVNLPLNILAHATWGAIEATVADGNAAAGAVSAATAELAAPTLAKLLYNKTEASQLTAEERQHIIALSSIAGEVAGGVTSQANKQSNTTANTLQNAALGGEIGESAVENNYVAIVARGCSLLSFCRKAMAKEVIEFGAKAGITSIIAEHIIENISNEEFDHLISLMLLGNNLYTERFIEYLNHKYASSIAVDPTKIPNLEGYLIKPNEPLVLPYPVEENKDSTIVDIKPDVVDTSVISGSEINVGNWEDNVVTRELADYSDKPKKKANNSKIGDIVRTPDSHPEDFISKGKNKINKSTGEIWQKSDSKHTDKSGEWKVGLNGNPPTVTRKITVGRSNGKIIKIDK